MNSTWVNPVVPGIEKIMSALNGILEGVESRQPYIWEIQFPKNRFSRQAALRKFYELAEKEIFESGSCEWGIDTYEIDCISVFTPIEEALWHDIRAADCVFYPQYPVGRYFVDFASPVAKVAIECDGLEWHKDKKKDAARQAEIEACGWSVYRITGRDCKTDFDDETHEAGEARKFIDSIARKHNVTRGGYRENFLRHENDESWLVGAK